MVTRIMLNGSGKPNGHSVPRIGKEQTQTRSVADPPQKKHGDVQPLPQHAGLDNALKAAVLKLIKHVEDYPELAIRHPEGMKHLQQLVRDVETKPLEFGSLVARLKEQKRPNELNPFRLPQFPKEAMPAKDTGMALDDGEFNDTFNWAGAAWGNAMVSMYQEGLVFPGYTYLAELAQRAEYRKMSETIATEATRKWIKLQAVALRQSMALEDDEDMEGLVEQGEEIEKEEENEGEDALSYDFAEGEEEEQQQQQMQPPEEEEPDPEEERQKEESAAREKRIRLIEKEFERLKLQKAFEKWSEIDSYFGRSHLYIDVGDPDSEDAKNDVALSGEELMTSIGNGTDEASYGKIGPGYIRRVKVVEPLWCYPTTYNSSNPLSTNWYEPDMWYVMGNRIHKTRLLKLVAREVPDILKPAYAFGGLSLSQMAKPYVDNWLNTRQAVADIIRGFATWVLSTDLSAALEDSGDLLFKRLELFNLLRNNKGVMAINKETEEFANVSAPLGTLDSLQAQTQEHMSSVSGIPIVKLLGIQPAGLNASSEGEIRTFYDAIAAYQEKNFRDPLTIILRMVQISLFGEIDEDITFKFVPLWELDEGAAATKRKTEADTDAVYIDSGVLAPIEVRQKLASDPDSPYSSIDVEDVPEPPGQMEGMQDGQGNEEGEAPGGPGEGGLGGGKPGGGSSGGGGDFYGGGGDADDGGPGTGGEVPMGGRRPGPLGREYQDLQKDRGVRGKLKLARALLRLKHKKEQEQAQGEFRDQGGGSFVGDVKPRDKRPVTHDGAIMLELLLMAFDKGNKPWEEGKHPRGPDGKFTSYGAAPGLANKAKKLGFSKMSKTSSGKVKLEHSSGAVLVIEPTGEAESKAYTFYGANGEKPIHAVTGQTAKSFVEKIGPLLTSSATAPAPAPKPAPTPKPEPVPAPASGAYTPPVSFTSKGKQVAYGFANIAGFEHKGPANPSDPGGKQIFKKGDNTAYVSSDGYFAIYDKDDNTVKQGDHVDDIEDWLAGGGIGSGAHTSVFKGTMNATAQNVEGTAEKNGFVHSPGDDTQDTQIYKKGDLVLKLWEDGEWTLKKESANSVGMIASGSYHEQLTSALNSNDKTQAASAPKPATNPAPPDFKTFSNFADYAAAWTKAGLSAMSEGLKSSLNTFFNEKAKGNPAPAAAATGGLTPEQKAEAEKLVKSKNAMYSALNGKEYKNHPDPKLEAKGIMTFKKGDAAIKVASNGDWVAESPGFSAKSGSGEENLKAFLNGEKAYGSKWHKASANWEDEHDPKTIEKTAEEQKQAAAKAAEQQAKAAANMTAKQKEEAEKNKASAELSQQKTQHIMEIHKIKEKKQQEWQGTLSAPSAKQKSALTSYSGSGYTGINTNLRKGGKLDPNTNAKHIKDYLDTCSFPEDYTLYRGVSGEYADVLTGSLVNGSLFQDKGFVSTTIRPDMSFVSGAKLKMKITVKKGSRGASIKHWSSHPSEDEILFTAGTHFRVVKAAETDANGDNWMHLEMLLPEEHPK